MHIPQVFVILILSTISIFVTGAMVGGTSPIDIHDEAVVEATQFAIENAYRPNEVFNFEVVKAMKQVVNGMRYVLTVKITLREDPSKCFVKQFGVWKRGGPPGTLLVENETLDMDCDEFNE